MVSVIHFKDNNNYVQRSNKFLGRGKHSSLTGGLKMKAILHKIIYVILYDFNLRVFIHCSVKT